MGIVFTALISLIIANSIDLTEIAIIGSASFLLVFALVNASAFSLRKKIGGHPWIYLVAFLLSFLALLILLIHTYESNTRAILVFFSFIGLSILFELIYGRLVRGHFLGRSYTRG
jgi:DMSO/TMAO reductase YedYZ heme-binding membrane subunit